MSPGLQPGQMLAIRPAPADNLQPGQIVVFRNHANKLTVHRLVRREVNGQFLSRGDNSPAPDAPWGTADYVGRLEAAKKPDGRWVAPTYGLNANLHLWIQGARPQRLFHALRAALTPFAWQTTNPPAFAPKAAISMKNTENIQAPGGRYETQELGKELAVYDIQTGDLHVLNEIAALVYKGAANGQNLSQITLDVSKRWPEIALDRIRTDVESVHGQLAATGLITLDP